MSDESFFREVEEELRQEQLKKLWRKYGAYAVGAAIIIVVGIGGYNFWTFYQANRAAETGARYEAALDLAREGKEAEAVKEFEAIAQGAPGAYETLAEFSRAAFQAKLGESDSAVQIYDSLARSAPDPVLRDLARIRAALLLVDSAGLEEMRRRVAAIDDDGNPWRHSAREVLALTAYRTGDEATALELFQKMVADQGTPAEARQRAQIMLTLINPGQEARGSTSTPGQAGEAESR